MISLAVENRKTFIEMDSVVGKGKTCFPNINSICCLLHVVQNTASTSQKIPHSLLVPLTAYVQGFAIYDIYVT